jgi:hypothetical protein
MKNIQVDEDVFKALQEKAIPFEDITPNHVIRRLLGLKLENLLNLSEISNEGKFLEKEKLVEIIPIERSQLSEITSIDKYEHISTAFQDLRKSMQGIHPAFITFLIDKYCDKKGDFTPTQVIDFFRKFNLDTERGLWNPCMPNPHGGEKDGKTSCERCVDHYRQTRKFACWNGRDLKNNCDDILCRYHPKNENSIIRKNRCDLRKGVIWKRDKPDFPYKYGNFYINIIKEELLKNKKVPLKNLLAVFYHKEVYDNTLLEKFFKDFHLSEIEIQTFFTL